MFKSKSKRNFDDQPKDKNGRAYVPNLPAYVTERKLKGALTTNAIYMLLLESRQRVEHKLVVFVMSTIVDDFDFAILRI